jgi:F-type H+-transporting ATPase subunit epsilon
MPIHVEVVSQEKKLFDEPQADMVIIPGREGKIGVLPNHSPLLTTMQFGELIIRKGTAEESFAIYGGVAEVRPDKVVILADAADFASEVSVRAVQEAMEEARRALDSAPPEEHRYLTEQLRKAELALYVKKQVEARGRVGIRVVQERQSRDN